MVEGKTIICFASGYDAPPTSKHHIMHLLAEKNVVVWVNYHASRAPTASSSDLLYMARKLRQIAKGVVRPRKNLHVITPLVVPLPSSAVARRLNRLLIIAQIKRAVKRIGSGPIQIWSFTPDIAYTLGHFNEEKVVYYCVDDHASFSGYDKDQVLRDEEELCRKSDMVITTSSILQEKKRGWNANTILVTHGVDFHHFNQAITQDLNCPKDLEEIPRPRLGFFGLIRDWVDVDLMATVAKKRPEWHIVIIGDADSSIDLAKYRSITNMHFLGRRPYGDLPAYCRHLDAGLIPFKINELTIAVNPIKLREYLAAGLPVISTPLPEVGLYKSLVDISDAPDGFITAFERHMNESDADRIKRSETMVAESWPGKMEALNRALLSARNPECHRQKG